MPSATVVHLAEQGVVALTGPDAGKLLQGILTNDLDVLDKQPSLAAGLLMPQGKILFDLVAYRAPEGLMVETAAVRLADLIKRLTLYKLRADVRIADASVDWAIVASWGGEMAWPAGSLGGADPRLADFGERRLIPAGSIATLGPRGTIADYDARRVALGVPEGGRDYVLGDTFPHEANFDLRSGVSFTKGCYVGQEVVARMQHKTTVRKRIVRLHGAARLTSGVDVMAGSFSIGRVGTVAGNDALAFLKLDRAEELTVKGETLTAGDVPVEIDPRDIAAFEAIAAAKAHRS